ncbi:putative ABC transporter permease subunit [[Clostridium] innocuum]|uniref:putative ABC transporter permease subunit n=1 Tax=Clostridium innocuum TaxID=1522 RepID=UPI003258EABE
MRKYLSLTRVLLKNSMGMMSDGKSKKAFNVFIYGVLAVCMIPLGFTLYMMFNTAMAQLQPLQQEGTVLALGFHISSLVTFLFSIFLIPSIFYFSKDSETLLALPLPPQTILSAKFSVCLVYEYAFTLIVCVPLYIAYANNAAIGIPYILLALVIFITLPIYPLVLSSIITMLLMRFVPFFKNRDRFNMIAGILSIILAFGFSFAMNSGTIAEDPNALISMLTQGNNSMISLFSKIFPAIPFAAEALISSDALQLVYYILITCAALAVLVILGKWLYFKGAIGFSETKSSRKELSAKDFARVSRHSKVRTYLIKELRLLIRTPVYAINCIGMCILMPIMLLVIFITADADVLLQQLPDITPYLDGMLPYAVLAGMASGFLFSNLNMISSTAISREGTNISFMKYIPMSLKQQLQAKVLSGILMSVISMLLTMVCVYFLLPIFPLTWYFAAAAASLITIVLGNYASLALDILHPKLVWEQEAAAVKQNMSGIVSMLAGMAMTVVTCVLLFILPDDYLLFGTAGMVIVCIAVDVVFYMRLDSFAQKRFHQL